MTFSTLYDCIVYQKELIVIADQKAFYKEQSWFLLTIALFFLNLLINCLLKLKNLSLISCNFIKKPYINEIN